MTTIPAINCPDLNCIKGKLKEVLGFFSEADGWVQLDITDRKFTDHATWNRPEELEKLIADYKLPFKFEVHLMVDDPELIIKEWVRVGIKRLILHLEGIEDLELKIQDLRERTRGVELGLAINPDTPVEELLSFLKDFKFVQILAVHPGKAAQKFDEGVLEKIEFLKKNHPNVIIEVDGGINPETARLAKKAGADILASASYIFDSPNPKKAYEELKAI